MVGFVMEGHIYAFKTRPTVIVSIMYARSADLIHMGAYLGHYSNNIDSSCKYAFPPHPPSAGRGCHQGSFEGLQVEAREAS